MVLCCITGLWLFPEEGREGSRHLLAVTGSKKVSRCTKAQMSDVCVQLNATKEIEPAQSSRAHLQTR